MVSATVALAARKFGLGQLVEIALGLERGLGDRRTPCSWNFSLRATKSVSELTSTSAASLASAARPIRPSAATRPAFLAALAEALGPQPVDRGLHVAVGLVERRLAIHHARAGLVAQVLHHGCGDRRHALPLSCLACSGPRSRRPSPTRCCLAGLRGLGLSRRPVSCRRVRLCPDPCRRSAAGFFFGRRSARRRSARNRPPRPRAPARQIGSSAAPRSTPPAPWARSMPSIAARAIRSQ